ncbi:hypothetical protein [Halovenus sp. HT40]|uniref:hypothetical protein n=1 Tax=Halovenus sp. HT40 TaxID=3126691 RepID=UPI00300F28F8
MDIAVIGVGGAGGRIVDRLARELGTGAGSPLETVHAIDTDTASLDALGSVPTDARHAIGQFETGGKGTDGDREQAAEIIEDERMEIRRAVEDGIPTTVDAIVVAAGLAGGTGSAVTPSLAAGLAKVYEQPVYAVSVLPADAETDERERSNTAAALSGLEDSATAQIVFDNEAWLWGSRSLEGHSDRINGELTGRLRELFTLGEESGGAVGEQVVDTRDLIGTLAGGNLVSVGYASRPIAAWRGASSSLLDGLKRRVLGDDTDEYERGRALQRTLGWATRGTMTFECPRGAATHGLVAFRGPPEWLRGDAISKGREWLADRAGIEQLRSGDIPSDSASSLDVLVVLAGIEQAPRIEAFGRDESGEHEDEEDSTDEELDQNDDAEPVAGPESDETTKVGEAESEADETEKKGDASEDEPDDSDDSDGETDDDVDDSEATEKVAEAAGASDDTEESEPDDEDASNWGVPPGESADEDAATPVEETDDESTDENAETEGNADSTDEADADIDDETGPDTDATADADTDDESGSDTDTTADEPQPGDDSTPSSGENADTGEKSDEQNSDEPEY